MSRGDLGTKPKVARDALPWVDVRANPTPKVLWTDLLSLTPPMSQSLSAVYVHAIFSTKGRTPFLRDVEMRSKLHAYLAGISHKLDSPMILAGGGEDHVHLLARQSRTISQADWVKEVKRASMVWLKEHHAGFRDFAWQAGYGIFSVSPSNLGAVEKYVANQEEHHRTKSFQEEFRAMLKRHRVAWDERYVWD